MKILLLVLSIWIVLPVAISFARYSPPAYSWSTAPRHSSGLAPDPSVHPEAIIQVYVAQAFSWRGIFATHPWIIVKRAGEASYTRYEVMGWGGGTSLKINHSPADALWYGAAPRLLLDRRGPEAEPLIGKVESAIESYPFKDVYRTWPGPNSNTFVAHVGREVPELHLDLPANSVGKDYRPWNRPIGRAPSGGGVQVSLLGVLGVTLAPEEGVEVNLLGMSFGIDVLRPALRLPAIGRLGLQEAPASAG
jgi:hypothetical protein